LHASATTRSYILSLHDALPIWCPAEREREVHCASARFHVGHGVTRCSKRESVGRAIGIEVPGGGGESACPVGRKPPDDRRSIIRVVEAGNTERVVTGYAGRTECVCVRALDGS